MVFCDTQRVFLFIGGAMDGDIRQLPDNYPIRYEVLQAPEWDKLTLTSPPRLIRHVYKRQTLAAESDAMHVFVLDSLTQFEALKMLVANYRPRKGGTL